MPTPCSLENLPGMGRFSVPGRVKQGCLSLDLGGGEGFLRRGCIHDILRIGLKLLRRGRLLLRLDSVVTRRKNTVCLTVLIDRCLLLGVLAVAERGQTAVVYPVEAAPVVVPRIAGRFAATGRFEPAAFRTAHFAAAGSAPHRFADHSGRMQRLVHYCLGVAGFQMDWHHWPLRTGSGLPASYMAELRTLLNSQQGRLPEPVWSVRSSGFGLPGNWPPHLVFRDRKCPSTPPR